MASLTLDIDTPVSLLISNQRLPNTATRIYVRLCLGQRNGVMTTAKAYTDSILADYFLGIGRTGNPLLFPC
jgi:hypothetical protein